MAGDAITVSGAGIGTEVVALSVGDAAVRCAGASHCIAATELGPVIELADREAHQRPVLIGPRSAATAGAFGGLRAAAGLDRGPSVQRRQAACSRERRRDTARCRYRSGYRSCGRSRRSSRRSRRWCSKSPRRFAPPDRCSVGAPSCSPKRLRTTVRPATGCIGGATRRPRGRGNRPHEEPTPKRTPAAMPSFGVPVAVEVGGSGSRSRSRSSSRSPVGVAVLLPGPTESH
jgi:hypothetical protein